MDPNNGKDRQRETPYIRVGTGTTRMARPPHRMCCGKSRELHYLTEDRYRDLRRPKIVTFFRNGDHQRRFTATLRVTPNRYTNLYELLTELSRRLPMAHGVRRLLTPVGGSAVLYLSELRDGATYVCASLEPFRRLPYGSGTARAPVREYTLLMHEKTHCLLVSMKL